MHQDIVLTMISLIVNRNKSQLSQYFKPRQHLREAENEEGGRKTYPNKSIKPRQHLPFASKKNDKKVNLI